VNYLTGFLQGGFPTIKKLSSGTLKNSKDLDSMKFICLVFLFLFGFAQAAEWIEVLLFMDNGSRLSGITKNEELAKRVNNKKYFSQTETALMGEVFLQTPDGLEFRVPSQNIQQIYHTRTGNLISNQSAVALREYDTSILYLKNGCVLAGHTETRLHASQLDSGLNVSGARLSDMAEVSFVFYNKRYVFLKDEIERIYVGGDLTTIDISGINFSDAVSPYRRSYVAAGATLSNLYPWLISVALWSQWYGLRVSGNWQRDDDRNKNFGWQINSGISLRETPAASQRAGLVLGYYYIQRSDSLAIALNNSLKAQGREPYAWEDRGKEMTWVGAYYNVNWKSLFTEISIPFWQEGAIHRDIMIEVGVLHRFNQR
jgi:hypothetical protein